MGVLRHEFVEGEASIEADCLEEPILVADAARRLLNAPARVSWIGEEDVVFPRMHHVAERGVVTRDHGRGKISDACGVAQ